MNTNWKFSAWAGKWYFCGTRLSGIRFDASSPSGSMPFNIGHKHRRGYIAGELGAERWHRRLRNPHLWRACHLYWRTRRKPHSQKCSQSRQEDN